MTTIRKPIIRDTNYLAAEAVTASDVAALAVFDGLMVTVSGNVSLEFLSGDIVTLPVLQPGVIYPVSGVRVRATGTTATGIVVLR